MKNINATKQDFEKIVDKVLFHIKALGQQL